MLCRTEEGVLAHSLLLTEFTFQSASMLLSQVIRISHLSPKLILTLLVCTEILGVLHTEVVLVVSVMWYLEVFLLLLRRIFT